jgi:hypothetical protein
MAKKKASGVNKSKAIKEALAANPDASSREIADGLASRGIPVTPTYVANVKSTLKKRRGRPKGKKGSRTSGAKSVSDSVSLSALVQANKLATELGGVEKARDLLAALAKLRA